MRHIVLIFFCYNTGIIMGTPCDEACSHIHFDPNKHLENTVKAFQEFLQCFQPWYDALYPDPPKVSLETAIERWKISQATTENPSPKPNLEQFDEICEDTKSRVKIFSSIRLVHGSTYRKSKKKCKAEWVYNNYDSITNQLRISH